MVLGLAVSVGILTKQLRHEREERKRYQNNTEALLEENQAFRTTEGKWAMTVQALKLEREEFLKYREEDAKTIASQGIKIKRLESMTSTVTTTELEMTAPIRTKPPDPLLSDSIELRTFYWSDTWTNISGIIASDSVSLHYQSVDTLKQFIYRIPKRFLFIRYGTKGIRQTIQSSNENTKIIYNEYIELK